MPQIKFRQVRRSGGQILEYGVKKQVTVVRAPSSSYLGPFACVQVENTSLGVF